MDTPKDLRLCCANCKWYAQKKCLMPDSTFVGYCCKDNIKILKIFNEYGHRDCCELKKSKRRYKIERL